jgi:hypothetical protein
MRAAVLFAGVALMAASCTRGRTSSSPSATLGSSPSAAQATPSPSTVLPYAGLSIGPRASTDGWVVMADGFGINVAGGGTLQNVDPKTGQKGNVARIGTWDYDFTTLGRLGEGSLWLPLVQPTADIRRTARTTRRMTDSSLTWQATLSIEAPQRRGTSANPSGRTPCRSPDRSRA